MAKVRPLIDLISSIAVAILVVSVRPNDEERLGASSILFKFKALANESHDSDLNLKSSASETQLTDKEKSFSGSS